MVIKEPPWKTYLVEATDPVFSIDECNKIIDLGQNLPQRDARIGGPVRQKGKKNYIFFAITFVDSYIFTFGSFPEEWRLSIRQPISTTVSPDEISKRRVNISVK